MMRLSIKAAVAACAFGLSLADLQAGVSAYTEYTRIPKTKTATAGDVVLLPVKWKDVKKIYVRYAYGENPPSWPMLFGSTTDGTTAGNRVNPYLGIQSGSTPRAQSGSLNNVSAQLTPGDDYGPGLDAVHEATISFTCTIDNYFVFGCGWNNLNYHTTTDFYALKLYGADDVLLADMRPAVSDGVAGFVDVVSGGFYERANSDWDPFVAGPEQNEITIAGHPLELGVPDPNYGLWENLSAGQLTATCPQEAANAEDTIRATCTGWTLQKLGESPVSGSGTTATIPYDVSYCHATLTWVWANSFAVDVRTIVNGRVVETERCWTATDGTLALTAPATPDGCEFLGWCGSGVTADNRDDATLELALTEPGAVSAIFRNVDLAQTLHLVDNAFGSDEQDAPIFQTLAFAYGQSAAQDEIVLLPGVHPLAAYLVVEKAITIRGVGAPEETRIDGGLKDAGISLSAAGASLRDLTLQNIIEANYSPSVPLVTVAGTVVSNCVLSALAKPWNCAMELGGGLVTACRVVSNTEPNTASLIRITSATMENCLVANNAVKNLICWSGNNGTLRNSTIVDNAIIDSSANAAVNMGSAAKVYNNIIWGNTNKTGAVANWLGAGSTANWINNCTYPLSGMLGSGNIDSDPMFLSDGCHIKSGSPCNHKAAPAYAPAIDIDGIDRGDKPSIGAFEYVDLGELEVTISVSKTFVRTPETITLTPNIVGTYSGTPSYRWDLKGDGSVIVTDERLVLSDVGPYRPKLTVTVDGKDPVTVECPATLAIHAAGAQTYHVNYVAGDDAKDGLTPATAWKTLASALDSPLVIAGDEIVLARGTHPLAANQLVAKAVTIRGEGAPEETQIDGNGKDVGLSLSAAGASLRDLTLRNMVCANNNFPLTTAADTVVSNCVLTALVKSYDCALTLGGGLVTGCRLVSNENPLGNLVKVYSATMENCFVASNTVQDVVGWSGANGTLRNCTIVGNAIVKQNGAAVNMGSAAKVYNNIVWGNTNETGSVANWTGADSTANWINNCTYPLTGMLGRGNIDSDPMFLSDGRHIKSGSPCNHKANPDYAPAVDIDGIPRGATPSIGAFEYVDLGELEVSISVSATFVRTPETITLTPNIVGTYSGTPSYRWDLKGDGSVIVTDERLVLSDVGPYRPKLTVTVGGKDPVTVECPATLAIHAAGAQTYFVNYVAGDDAKDGMTPATAWKTLVAALDSPMVIAGDEIVLARGTHPLAANLLVVKAVTIRGAGAPEETRIDGGLKDAGISLSAAGASLRDLTLQNIIEANYSPSVPLKTAAGTVVSNCVLSALAKPWARALEFEGGLVTGCRIVSNADPDTAGLIRISAATMENCLVANNAIKTMICWWGSNGTLRNSTIVDNAIIDSSANAAVNMGSAAKVYNNIIWGNTNKTGAVANWLGGGIANWSHNCTMPTNGLPDSANIDLDPQFAPRRAYHLSFASPCRNAGSNELAPTGVDLDGYRRKVGRRVDLGCFEFEGPGLSVIVR